MTALNSFREDALTIAADVRARRRSAREVTEAALGRIASLNPALNCFTQIMSKSALAQAEEIDRQLNAGSDPGSLAGAPFAVKNLFDVAGVTTLAGSKIQAGNPPAGKD